MSESKKQPTFADGLFALAGVMLRLQAAMHAPAKCSCENNGDLCAFCQEREDAQTADRKEVECIRCAEWPCICGDPEFESWVSAELDRAEREGRD